MSIQYHHGTETVEVGNGSRPIQTVKSSIVGFVGTSEASEADVPMEKNILIKTRAQAEKFGPGTLRDTYRAHADQGVTTMIVRRVPAATDPAAQHQHVLGDPAAMTGIYGLRAVSSDLGITPRILSAPGFTGARLGGNANPVGAALKGIAEKMRATAIVDGPNTTEAEALQARNDYGSSRVYLVDPFVKVFREGEHVDVPASAFVSAAMSKRDVERGFWWSVSNSELNGVTGTSRPVLFGLSEKETESNRLNEQGVGTIVNRNGFRIWGQRSTAIDPLWAFLQVRRTCDMVYESIEEGHQWAMDRPLSRGLASAVVDGVNGYLRTLKSRGAILGGKAWLDQELNSDEVLKAGQLYVDFDIEPPAGLERLTFRAFRNDDYYEEIFDLAA